MKKLLLSISFLAATLLSVAQDVIVTKSADEIQSKVLKVSDNEVEYKKWSNPEGPTYVMKVSDVFMIKYQNGEKDVFTDKQVASGQLTTEDKSASGTGSGGAKKEKKNRFSIVVGYVTQSVVPTNDKKLYSWCGDKKFSNGIMLGVSWNKEVNKGFGYEFCAFGFETFFEKYSGETYDMYGNVWTYSGNVVCRDFYFSPAKFQYRYKFGKNFAISVLTGPTIDLAMSHVYYTNYQQGFNSLSQTDSYNMFNKNSELKNPVYINWDFEIGFSYRFLTLRAGTSVAINSVEVINDFYAKVKRPLFVTLSFTL